MAHYQDLLSQDQGWIHELARGEIHPEADRLLNLGKSFDPQQLVEESTVEFLEELREQFTSFSKIFNGLSENGSRYQDIKIYSIAQTPADFMLFRNQVKLMISNSSHGVITISFSQHSRGTAAIDGQPHGGQQGNTSAAVADRQELTAQVGPFRDVYWAFDQQKVNPLQVAKFYFSEFVRATRDTRKSKVSNQVLLEQLKTFLQEKGFDV